MCCVITKIKRVLDTAVQATLGGGAAGTKHSNAAGKTGLDMLDGERVRSIHANTLGRRVYSIQAERRKEQDMKQKQPKTK